VVEQTDKVVKLLAMYKKLSKEEKKQVFLALHIVKITYKGHPNK